MNVALTDRPPPTQSPGFPGYLAALRMSRAAIAAPEDFSALLLAVARQQDQIAFARLFEHFAPRIKRWLASRGLPALVAEELAQETLLAVWRKAALFDPDRANAATWIFSIARNQSIDYRRRDHSALHDPETEIDPNLADPADAAETLSQAEDEARLLASLSALSAEQMKVLGLAYFHDRSHSQIASELGLPLGTVKSRLRLALEKLRAALEPQ